MIVVDRLQPLPPINHDHVEQPDSLNAATGLLAA
jgi:hypothetical protein